MTLLDRIEAAENAATKGPWFDMLGLSQLAVSTTGAYVKHLPSTPEDVRFCALLRNHAADLIAVAKSYQRAGIVGCAGLACSCERCRVLAPLLREDGE